VIDQEARAALEAHVATLDAAGQVIHRLEPPSADATFFRTDAR